MPPARQPNPEELKNLQLMEAIQTAPDTTVRTVLRALCGDETYKARIRTLMLDKKFPLKLETADASADGTQGSGSINNKRKATRTEICVQCNQPFELGDNSKTCRYHPHDKQLNNHHPSQQEMPLYRSTPTRSKTNQFCRTENPGGGFVYSACCRRKGVKAPMVLIIGL
ncbi:hypothetical protein B0T20DRAFT_405288 [Sordaria brevicollis]|uniref:C2H2-type domain-containing protein n=1 Tax=Sordaria brevicollis TaxID=83679 RepID=A0AAE0PJ19_SORBR|nr:hypothetical protein B0T20DRAFT_405288 [Sordaria brevicollis]